MSIIYPRRILPKAPTRLPAIAVLLALLASFIGNALIQQIEKRAADDRLSVGMTAPTCVDSSCYSPYKPSVDSERFEGRAQPQFGREVKT
jgi:hypothetical protein